VVSIREERPQTAIDYPAGEDLAFGRSAFSFEEAAGDATAGIGVFTVIHREGQEVHALTLALFRARRDQNHGVAHADDGRAVGLFGDLAGFETEGFAVDLDGLSDDIHFFSFFRRASSGPLVCRHCSSKKARYASSWCSNRYPLRPSFSTSWR
jgi:hypothetical protein